MVIAASVLFWVLFSFFTVIFILLIPLAAILDLLRGNFEKDVKLFWILIIIFIPFMGALLYFLLGRKKRLD